MIGYPGGHRGLLPSLRSEISHLIEVNQQSPQRRLTPQLKSSEHTTMAILALITGLGGGFGAVGFRHLIDLFQTISYGSPDNLLDVIQSTPWYLRIVIPALGGLVIGPIVYFLAREAKGHGVPEVMEAVALRSGVIRKRIVFIYKDRGIRGLYSYRGLCWKGGADSLNRVGTWIHHRTAP